MTTDHPFPNWFGHVLRFFLLGVWMHKKTQKGNKKQDAKGQTKKEIKKKQTMVHIPRVDLLC